MSRNTQPERVSHLYSRFQQGRHTAPCQTKALKADKPAKQTTEPCTPKHKSAYEANNPRTRLRGTLRTVVGALALAAWTREPPPQPEGGLTNKPFGGILPDAPSHAALQLLRATAPVQPEPPAREQ